MGVYVVADGMGGQAAGEVASKRAIEIVPRELKKYINNLVGPDEIRSIIRRLVQGVVPRTWIRRLQSGVAPRSIGWEFCNILEPDPQRRLRLNISTRLLEEMHVVTPIPPRPGLTLQ